jgi:probable F420-dependent oxidoreductase
MRRWGLTIPLPEISLPDHSRVVSEAVAAGYTDLWSAEVNGSDAFTPLTLAAGWDPDVRLGTAIVPVFTRGPALLAMSAATLAEVAPGRAVVGIGASSPAIVAQWNGLDFTEPFARTRDMLRFLRKALAGETVDEQFPTFRVRRFRLDRPPAQPPTLYLAALRPGMLRLAAAEADGAILNWLAASDVPRVTAELRGAPDGFDVAARIFVCPTTDAAYVRTVGKRMITAYLTVGAYAEFHRWLGREPVLGPVWDAWAAGDRKGALAAVPDELVDALVLHGTPAQVRKQVEDYVAGGVRTPVLSLVPAPGTDLLTAVRALGPATGTEEGSWS